MSRPGPNRKVTDEDVLGVFASREDEAEPLTASNVAERLDCSRRTALNHLNELTERGELASKKVGARARVYWRPLVEARPEAPAAPLKRLVGLLTDEEADAAEARQDAFREAFDERMHGS